MQATHPSITLRQMLWESIPIPAISVEAPIVLGHAGHLVNSAILPSIALALDLTGPLCPSRRHRIVPNWCWHQRHKRKKFPRHRLPLARPGQAAHGGPLSSQNRENDSECLAPSVTHKPSSSRKLASDSGVRATQQQDPFHGPCESNVEEATLRLQLSRTHCFVVGPDTLNCVKQYDSVKFLALGPSCCHQVQGATK